MTTFEHCLSVYESDGPYRLATEDDLFVFKRRDALNAILITAGSERSFHARAGVGVKLDSEPRRETLRATGADKARIIEPYQNHDAIAHDPLINRAQRHLTREVAVLVNSAGPNGRFVTQA